LGFSLEYYLSTVWFIADEISLFSALNRHNDSAEFRIAKVGVRQNEGRVRSVVEGHGCSRWFV
jgi:hypothetical protein